MKKALFLLITIFILSRFCFAQIGGYALNFDGTDDYVSVPHSSNLNFTAFTVEAWIFPTGTDSKIFGKTAYGSAVPGFSMGYTSDCKLFCECKQDWGSNYVASTSTATASLNVWSHVVMTWNSGGYLKAYINGVEVINVASLSLSITNTNYFVIGRAPWISPSQGPFKGRIDEVRVWNLVRTQDQIKTSMFKELAGNESGLVAYYKMSNGSGTSLSDNQTNVTANTGTLNGPTWKASGCFAGPRNCLNFDGVDEYVNCGSPEKTRIANNFTISSWVKASSVLSSRWYDILTNHWKYAQSGIIIAINGSNGKLHYAISGASGTILSRDPESNIKDDKWHNVVITFESGTTKTYLDGILIDTYTQTTITSLVYSGSYGLWVGRDSGEGGEWWKGGIDEVSIWDKVFSASEIRENMFKTLSGTESNLKAYYRFDHLDGTTLYDYSSSPANGTLVNMETADWITSDAFNTWLGSESNAWSTPANWSRGTVPASTDNVGIYKWTLGNELSLSGTPTLNHLIISSTSSPTLSSNFTVNGDLFLNKDIDLNGYTITLGSSGYLDEGSYRFYGTSGSITTTRTLSNISAQNIAGLGATITTSANMGSTTITRGHTTQGGSLSISRYYNITPTTNTGLNATLVFNYNDNELNGNTESDLKLYKSTDNGTSWTVQSSSTVNISANTITLTGMDGFSMWTAANYNSPMPVELISFASNINGRDVKLNWKTNKEINNKGFEVERKITESDWVKIGFVSGKGTTNNVTPYSFDDFTLNSGKYNYRLKQIDFNGNFTYYNLNGLVEIGIPSKFNLSQNYPNPFNPSTKIDFELPVESSVSIKVFDLSGKEVMSLINNEMMKAGYHTAVINSGLLSSGVFFCRLTAGKFSSVKKIVLLK